MKLLLRGLITAVGFAGSAAPSFGAAPTVADLAAATKASVSAALTRQYGSTLSGTAAGMTCDGDTSIGADGNTVDTDGLLYLIANAQLTSYGVYLQLPAGVCEINREIDIPITQSMRFSGSGIKSTTFQFITPPGGAVPANGLMFSLSNGASLTIDDFSITKRAGTNNGPVFLGTALSIAANSNTPNAGSVTTTNITVTAGGQGGQTDGWNTGLSEINLTAPMIENVEVDMPWWSGLPDPAGYVCTTSNNTQAPCAIHTLPSPTNPVATPANLGFGTATGIAIGGTAPSHFQTDTSIVGLMTTGGLAGLDLQRFQGVYVSDSKFVSDVYGVRADSFGTVSELLSVDNSQATTTLAGIYMNGIGGGEITGNYFTVTDSEVTNLPSSSAVWIRNGNDDTISGNNIVGDGNAVTPEYGIFLSADSPDGFPMSVTGNTIYSLSSPGSVCLGNDKNMGTVAASGNSLFSCANYISDATGGNGYGNNTLQYPDMYDNGSRGVQFPKSVTIGTQYDPGQLLIESMGVQKFLVDQNGNTTASGSLTTGGGITASGAVSGTSLTTGDTLVMTGNSAHSAAQEVVGNFYYPYGGSKIITLNPPSGGFPPITSGGVTIFGELSCSGSPGFMSWHVVGHYAVANSTYAPKAFAATVESDADSQALAATLVGNSTVTPVANPTAPGLQVVFGPMIHAVFDCTSVLTEMVAD